MGIHGGVYSFLHPASGIRFRVFRLTYPILFLSCSALSRKIFNFVVRVVQIPWGVVSAAQRCCFAFLWVAVLAGEKFVVFMAYSGVKNGFLVAHVSL